MTTQLYLTSHPPYVTSQPLCLCHHTDGTHICIDVSLYPWHHKCVSHHTWHTYDNIRNLYHVTFTLHDINDHALWCQTLHAWHHISSIWHHNHSLGHHTTLCMTSSPLNLTSHHCISVITTTRSMTSQPLYGWYRIQYTCDIVSPIFMA